MRVIAAYDRSKELEDLELPSCFCAVRLNRSFDLVDQSLALLA